MMWKRFKEEIKEEILKEILPNARRRESNGSFCELLWPSEISKQSVNVRLGNSIERVWNSIVPNTFKISIPGSQIDLIFERDNIIYFFEIKNNLNYDSTAAPAAIAKLYKKKDEIQQLFPEKKIVAKFLHNRFSTAKEAKCFSSQVSEEDLMGYSELFDLFGEKVTRDEYEIFFAKMGELIR